MFYLCIVVFSATVLTFSNSMMPQIVPSIIPGNTDIANITAPVANKTSVVQDIHQLIQGGKESNLTDAAINKQIDMAVKKKPPTPTTLPLLPAIIRSDDTTDSTTTTNICDEHSNSNQTDVTKNPSEKC